MGDRQTSIQFFNRAVKAINDKTQNYQALAYQLFSSACVADPTFWEAHYQAGCNNHDLKKYAAAIANCRLALTCKCNDQERAKILVNLGWCLHEIGHTDESHAVTKQALLLHPEQHLPWLNLSLIYSRMGEKELMLGAAKEAYRLAPDDTTVQISMAFAHLFTGDWATGLKFFEARFQWRLHNFLQFPYPKWEGEEGGTLFLVADQGLGDTLSYSRFVERAAAKCKYVHLYIQPQLSRLFMHAFMHLKNVNILPQPQPFPSADYWTTFVSLPYALKLTNAEIETQPHITYPRVPHPMRGLWKNRDASLHIGIAWRGSPLNDIDVHRNIPVENFFGLYEIPGVQLYSFQVGDKNHEMHEAGGAALVRDLVPGITDVVDTLGLLADLDLVITCESALGHIAALAGKECWIPYSYAGKDYRLGLRGEQLLWTPKTRTFNQGQGETWAPVFDRVKEALREKIDGRVGQAAE